MISIMLVVAAVGVVLAGLGAASVVLNPVVIAINALLVVVALLGINEVIDLLTERFLNRAKAELKRVLTDI